MRKILFLILLFPLSVFSNEDLFSAAEEGDLNKVMQLINSGISVNTINSEGRTLLQVAAREDDLDLVKRLIVKGAEVDNRGEKKNTPLNIAAKKSSLAIVKLLLDSGADINTIGNGGNSPLKRAVMANRMDVFWYLLNKGAKIDVIANNGTNALISAVYRDQTEMAQMLLHKGADPTIISNAGYSSLDHAYKHSTNRLDDVISGVLSPVQLVLNVSDKNFNSEKFIQVANYALHKRRWNITKETDTEFRANYRKRDRLFKVVLKYGDGEIRLYFVKGYGSGKIDYLNNLNLDMNSYLRSR